MQHNAATPTKDPHSPPSTYSDRDKSRLVELGLDRQVVDKLTPEEATVVLKDVLYMMDRNNGSKSAATTAAATSLPSRAIREKLLAMGRLVSAAQAAARDRLDSAVSASSSAIASRFQPAAVAEAPPPSPLPPAASMADTKAEPLLAAVEEDSAAHTTVRRDDDAAAAAAAGDDKKEKQDWEGQAASLLSIGDYAAALEHLDRAIEADPLDAKALAVRAGALFRLARFFEAASSYSCLLQLQPADAEAWSGKGACMFNMGILGGALECFDRALAAAAASGPGDREKAAQAWYGKACAAAKAGMADDSLRCLAGAIEAGGEAYRSAVRAGRVFSALRADPRFEQLLAPSPPPSPSSPSPPPSSSPSS